MFKVKDGLRVGATDVIDSSGNLLTTAANATLLNSQPGSFYQNASNLSAGTLLAGRMPALTGDITTSAGALATTLATVNSNVGSFGSTTAVPIITVNGKGLITAVSTATLGSAAVAATGTSGHTVPFLDGANTWSGTQTFATISATNFSGSSSGTNTGDQTTITGNAGSATILQTGRTIAMTGDVVWTSPSFNGSTNVTAAGTLATVNANVGSFGSATAATTFTVNAKGLITAAGSVTITPAFSSITSKPTTLSGYGITDAQPLHPQLTSLSGTAWTSGSQVVTLSAANTVTLVTVGSASGNILNKAAGDALYLGISATATNAALLNGQPASFYTNASTLTSGTVPAAQMPAHTGDVTSSAGSVALTLATVNSNTGSFGSTSAVPIITVNAKGLITAVSTAALGTAAVKNTGTSGNTVPLLDGVNTWSNDQTFSSNVVVTGNFSVLGSVFSVNATTLDVADSIITLAKNNSTGVIPFIGLKAERGSAGNDAYFVWDESTDSFLFQTAADDSQTSPVFVPIKALGFVSSVSTGTAPLFVSSTTLVANLNSDLLDGQNGTYYQNATNLTAGTLAAARMPALTGDITTSAGAVATTLATVNSNVGSFGSTSAVPIITVNAKGLITAVSTAALGTAAVAATGTSGHTVPFLDGANTWTGTQTYSTGMLVSNGSVTQTISAAPTIKGTVSGRYAYVGVSSQWGLSVVDFTNPGSPVVVGNVQDITNLNGAFGMALSGKYVFIAANGTTRVTAVDISNPYAPTVVGSISDSTYISFPRGLAIAGKYAYVASGDSNRITVLDISNPYAMTVAGSLQDNTYLVGTDGVFISGKYLYTAAKGANLISILDISDPVNPVLVGNTGADITNTSNVHEIYVVGKYLYAVSQNSNSLSIFDISNPASPVRMSTVSNSTTINQPKHLYVAGQYAYVTSNGGNRLTVIDVSNPVSPAVVSSLLDATNLSQARGIFISGKYALVAGNNKLSNGGFELVAMDPEVMTGTVPTVPPAG